MKTFIRLILIFGFLQFKSYAFAQAPSGKNQCYIFAFNPVYASGLIDMGYVAFEDLFLIVSDKPIKIDSVMSALSKKNYSSMLGILDTLKQKYKVYNLIKNNSKSKPGNRINRSLMDGNHYGSAFLFPLNDTIKKSSSLVRFVIRRYTFLSAQTKYKIITEMCKDFPNECKAIITAL
jgi:hypothetical protein